MKNSRNKTNFTKSPCGGFRGLCFIFALFSLSCSHSHKTIDKLLVGTYTEGTNSVGIYLYDLNLKSGTYNTLSTVANIVNPSYLALSPDKKFVYAVSEFGDKSTVHAYALTDGNKALKKTNEVQAGGSDPCYLAVTEQHVFTADYSGGSISVFGRNENGALTEVLQTIKHNGNSIAPNQQTPHVHQTKFTSNEHFLIVTDLGTDQISTYKYNKAEKENILSFASSLKVKEGSGPRHITFGKNGEIIYLLQENDGTVSVLSINEDGELDLLQETSVARNEELQNGAADIHISPDDKFVYATNRGDANDITCFAVNEKGLLEFVEQISTGGNGPRNFTITPDGSYILVANQRSNNIVIFERNKSNGKSKATGMKIQMEAPVCLVLF